MTQHRPTNVRVHQAAVIAAGLVVALVMVLLGLWQMERSLQTGQQAILDRASQPSVPLLEYVHPDNTFDDVYGKQVTVSGTYLPAQSILVVSAEGGVRVLTALQVPDGRVVPVVRGLAASRDTVPAAASGQTTVTGIFLPGEADATSSPAPGELGTVRMPLLAQLWTQRLTPGFITLDATGAASQGLRQASVSLPTGDKSLQNGSYAVQWWIFAATGVGISLMFARSLGDRARRDEDAEVAGGAGSVAAMAPPPLTGALAADSPALAAHAADHQREDD